MSLTPYLKEFFTFSFHFLRRKWEPAKKKKNCLNFLSIVVRDI